MNCNCEEHRKMGKDFFLKNEVIRKEVKLTEVINKTVVITLDKESEK